MDDATRLIAELQQKLAELDSKVAAYRHDMAAEFTRYSDKLLRDVPEDVSRRVSRAIAESMSNYPSLSPPSLPMPASTGDDTAPSPTPTASSTSASSSAANNSFSVWRARVTSPPPILPHTSGVPPETVRSPHARENEFHGLFTPTYLPLLDSADRPLHSPPTSPPPPPPPPPPPVSSPPPLPIADPAERILPSPAVPETSTTEITLNHTPLRPSPVHRLTDGTTSSIDSTGSDSSSKIRKSALRRRRSSSASKGPESPRDPSRRVRFSFQGEEVLPTSSPQATRAPVYFSLDSPEEEASTQAEDESYLGTSLADIEDEEVRLPRKVSSSQALRALSRNPLEEGTVWTVVNPDPDPEPEEFPSPSLEEQGYDFDGRMNSNTSPRPFSPDITSSNALPAGPLAERSSQDTAARSPGSPLEDLESHDSDSDSSDTGSLFMKRSSKRESPSPGPRSPLISPMHPNSKDFVSPLAAAKFQPAEPKPLTSFTSNAPPSHTAPESGDTHEPAGTNSSGPDTSPDYIPDDDLFQLDAADDDEGLRKVASARASLTEPVPVDDAEPEPELPEDRFSASIYSASPAVAIHRCLHDRNPPTTTTLAGSLPVGSIGSIRGHPIRIDVVKDPKLLEEAMAMGDFKTFVGSVNGRSGVDTSDANSYRASLKDLYSGTPMSLSQRMALERAAEVVPEDGEDENRG
ncbi:hypothetical protein NKR23_g2252 [Pleurostoma richardsiae]|uniref:Uncharacterized protein n=1 Tax=Pleurostoma richardsiae TaxID=41990 RepID=A0AA38S282_9PEZI|nr:hypothetical protein NKR23_g2252 [Pleurostoma richardsiae]